MGKTNRAWHEANRMPPSPSPKQRAQWHCEHALNCGCREITASIAELLRSQGYEVPGKSANGAPDRTEGGR